MRTLVLAAILMLARPGLGVRSARAEVARIRRHLARVEAQLRATDVSVLTAAQRAARARNLDRLHEYWVRGVFPVNTDFPGRHVPYFVDRFGTRCAMAYLIEQSGSGDLVRRISATRNNAYVRDLKNDAELGAWLRANGLTAAEAAWIQPAYGSPSDDFAGSWDGTVHFGVRDGTVLRYVLTNQQSRDEWMLIFPRRPMTMQVVALEGDSLVLDAAPPQNFLGSLTEFRPVSRVRTVLRYTGHTLTGTIEVRYASGAVVRGNTTATLDCPGQDSPDAVASFVRRIGLTKVRCMTELGAGNGWSAHQVTYRNTGGEYRFAMRTALLWGSRVGWIVNDVNMTDTNTVGMFRVGPRDASITSPAVLTGMAKLDLRTRWAKTVLEDSTVPRFVPTALVAALRDSVDGPLADVLVSAPRVLRDPDLLAALANLPLASAEYDHARNVADQALWEQSLALIAAPGTSHTVLLTLATWRDRHYNSCPGRPFQHAVVAALKERATREHDRAILDTLGTDPYRPRSSNPRWSC